MKQKDAMYNENKTGGAKTGGVPVLVKVRSILHSSTKVRTCNMLKHELVKNTLPSHHVKHDDTRVPLNCRRAEKQAVSRHHGRLDLSLKRVLSVEFVELSP
jgi:hypothetical protein